MTSFDATSASRAVLIDVMNVLGAFRDEIGIHFVLRNYPPNGESLADRVRPLLSKGLAREGYEILRGKFATLESVGPVWAARIAQEQGEDFEQSQRSAFEYAQALFDATKRGE